MESISDNACSENKTETRTYWNPTDLLIRYQHQLNHDEKILALRMKPQLNISDYQFCFRKTHSQQSNNSLSGGLNTKRVGRKEILLCMGVGQSLARLLHKIKKLLRPFSVIE